MKRTAYVNPHLRAGVSLVASAAFAAFLALLIHWLNFSIFVQ